MNSQKKQFVLYAGRSDGLGGRLLSILNGLILARHWNIDFKFSWPSTEHLKYQTTVPKENLFSNDFINQYYIEHDILKKKKKIELNTLKLKDFSFEELEQRTMDLEFDGLTIDQRSLNLSFLSKNIDTITYQEAFDTIKFIPNIARIIEKAKTFFLKDQNIAIHLRSGDIVFDRHRFDGRTWFDKVISFSEMTLLSNKLYKNNKVIIFGQDKEVCKYFSKRYNFDFIQDLYPQGDLPEIEKTIFEMIAMTNCQDIYAGQCSVFTKFASSLKGKDVLTIDEIKDFDELKNIVMCDMENNLEFGLNISFSAYKFLIDFEDKLNEIEVFKLLDFIIEMDKENTAYKLYKMYYYTKLNRLNDAEKMLSEFLRNTKHISYRRVIKGPFPKSNPELNKLLLNMKIPENSPLNILHLYNNRYFHKKSKNEIFLQLKRININETIREIVIKNLELDICNEKEKKNIDIASNKSSQAIPENNTTKKPTMVNKLYKNLLTATCIQKYSLFKKVHNFILQAFMKKDAFTHCNKGNLQQAESIAQNVITNNPSIAWAYYILGRVQWEQGLYDVALENVQKAIALEPSTTYFKKYYDSRSKKRDVKKSCISSNKSI